MRKGVYKFEGDRDKRYSRVLIKIRKLKKLKTLNRICSELE